MPPHIKVKHITNQIKSLVALSSKVTIQKLRLQIATQTSILTASISINKIISIFIVLEPVTKSGLWLLYLV